MNKTILGVIALSSTILLTSVANATTHPGDGKGFVPVIVGASVGEEIGGEAGAELGAMLGVGVDVDTANTAATNAGYGDGTGIEAAQANQ